MPYIDRCNSNDIDEKGGFSLDEVVGRSFLVWVKKPPHWECAGGIRIKYHRDAIWPATFAQNALRTPHIFIILFFDEDAISLYGSPAIGHKRIQWKTHNQWDGISARTWSDTLTKSPNVHGMYYMRFFNILFSMCTRSERPRRSAFPLMIWTETKLLHSNQCNGAIYSNTNKSTMYINFNVCMCVVGCQIRSTRGGERHFIASLAVRQCFLFSILLQFCGKKLWRTSTMEVCDESFKINSKHWRNVNEYIWFLFCRFTEDVIKQVCDERLKSKLIMVVFLRRTYDALRKREEAEAKKVMLRDEIAAIERTTNIYKADATKLRNQLHQLQQPSTSQR